MTKQAKINQLKKQSKSYTGVYLDINKVEKKAKGIFKARIKVDGVNYYLGYHATAEDAALAVNKKAKSLFNGEKKAKAAGYWNLI